MAAIDLASSIGLTLRKYPRKVIEQEVKKMPEIRKNERKDMLWKGFQIERRVRYKLQQ